MQTEWKKARLKDICNKITKGTTPSNIGLGFSQTGIKYIRSEMLTNDRKYISGEFLYISEKTNNKLKRSQLEANDILFSMAGVYLGKTAILRKCDIPSNTNQATALIRTNNNIVSPDYIYYYLNKKEIIKYVNAISGQSAQPNINLAQIGEIPISLPPLPVQQKIAGILSAYDDLIENNHKQIKLLEEAAQKLYKEWFVKLNYPGHEITKIVDGVPEGWKKGKLGNMLPIVTGKKDANYGTKDGKYPFFTCSQEPIKAPDFSFDANAILLAGNGDLNVKIYRGKFEAYQRTYVLVPYENKYLFICYRTIQDNLRKLIHGASGSTIKFITKGMIENIEILIPNDVILKSYNNFSESVLSKIEVLQNQIQHLQLARDKLLPRIMSGEIEV